MRHKVSNREVPHLWIHQTQDEAHGSNFYFEGRTIYSYGSHFPIARIYEGKQGRCVLFTTGTYSNTTCRHKSRTRMAIPRDVRLFEVPRVEASWASDLNGAGHEENLQALVGEITRLMEEAARARSAYQKEWRVNRAIPKAIDDAKEYAKWFGLRAPKLPKMPANWDEYGAELRKAAAKEAAETRKAAEAAQVHRLAEMREALDAWKAGASVGLPWDAPTMLRVKGAEIETSKGARVPLDHGRRALRLVRAIMASGQEYQRNGHTEHIGNYAIDKITVDGTLYAGCHVIPWAEIERIAPQVEAAETEGGR